MNIIETITGKGVKTTSKDLIHIRMGRPKSGDIIDFGENEGNYPFTSGRYGRIHDVGCGWANKDEVNICCQLGSAFLRDDGTVDISGGPFVTVKIDDLEPLYSVYMAQYWNWGDRTPGAHQGVYYHFERPVFKLAKQPDKR